MLVPVSVYTVNKITYFTSYIFVMSCLNDSGLPHCNVFPFLAEFVLSLITIFFFTMKLLVHVLFMTVGIQTQVSYFGLRIVMRTKSTRRQTKRLFKVVKKRDAEISLKTDTRLPLQVYYIISFNI